MIFLFPILSLSLLQLSNGMRDHLPGGWQNPTYPTNPKLRHQQQTFQQQTFQQHPPPKPDDYVGIMLSTSKTTAPPKFGVYDISNEITHTRFGMLLKLLNLSPDKQREDLQFYDPKRKRGTILKKVNSLSSKRSAILLFYVSFQRRGDVESYDLREIMIPKTELRREISLLDTHFRKTNFGYSVTDPIWKDKYIALLPDGKDHPVSPHEEKEIQYYFNHETSSEPVSYQSGPSRSCSYRRSVMDEVIGSTQFKVILSWPVHTEMSGLAKTEKNIEKMKLFIREQNLPFYLLADLAVTREFFLVFQEKYAASHEGQTVPEWDVSLATNFSSEGGITLEDFCRIGLKLDSPCFQVKNKEEFIKCAKKVYRAQALLTHPDKAEEADDVKALGDLQALVNAAWDKIQIMSFQQINAARINM
eukprot:g908.t1